MQLPESIRTTFKALANDVQWLHARWITYGKLFRHTDKRVDLLNETAGLFFFLVQRVFLSDIMLAICRLCDPPTTGKRANLVLGSLLEHLDPDAERAIYTEVESLLEKLRNEATPLRDHRNRRLAHRDFGAAVQAEANPLPEVTFECIGRCLDLSSRILNTIEVHFCDSSTGYELVSMFKGAEAVVAALIQAEDYEACLKEGVLTWEREHRAKYRGA